MIKSIGIPVRYDRVPGGRYPPMVRAKVGWSYIQWSLDTYDWRGRSTSAVLSSVKKKLKDGDIILCHDIKDNTPESTRQIVRYLEEQGYMPLTVDELFAKDGVKLEPDTVYYRCVDGDTSIRKD
jgi:peptidoglycan/xylan/chitin deacetylase (PgdA/CDA1 family)